MDKDKYTVHIMDEQSPALDEETARDLVCWERWCLEAEACVRDAVRAGLRLMGERRDDLTGRLERALVHLGTARTYVGLALRELASDLAEAGELTSPVEETEPPF